jgi:hypothetical protein
MKCDAFFGLPVEPKLTYLMRDAQTDRDPRI